MNDQKTQWNCTKIIFPFKGSLTVKRNCSVSWWMLNSTSNLFNPCAEKLFHASAVWLQNGAVTENFHSGGKSMFQLHSHCPVVREGAEQKLEHRFDFMFSRLQPKLQRGHRWFLLNPVLPVGHEGEWTCVHAHACTQLIDQKELKGSVTCHPWWERAMTECCNHQKESHKKEKLILIENLAKASMELAWMNTLAETVNHLWNKKCVKKMSLADKSLHFFESDANHQGHRPNCWRETAKMWDLVTTVNPVKIINEKGGSCSGAMRWPICFWEWTAGDWICRMKAGKTDALFSMMHAAMKCNETWVWCFMCFT